MASISEWIEAIKTAIYGEEVRSAIWQSLDAMNTQVDAINVDSAQITTNKNNIATNTAAIARHDGTAIASDEDLNNFSSIGEYYAATGAIATTLAHCPVTSNFVLMVLNKGGLRTQILTSADKLYIRTSTSTGWSAWFQYANQSDVDTNTAAIADLNSSLANKIIQVPWGTTITFPIAINHRFAIFAGNTALYTGINYSDRLTCNAISEGTEGLTLSATRDASNTTVTITTNKSANISALVF